MTYLARNAQYNYLFYSNFNSAYTKYILIFSYCWQQFGKVIWFFSSVAQKAFQREPKMP
jgi:hypothetical protein